MLAMPVALLAVPWTREFFDLAVPGPAAWVTAVVGAGLAVAGLWLTDERFVPGRGPGAGSETI